LQLSYGEILVHSTDSSVLVRGLPSGGSNVVPVELTGVAHQLLASIIKPPDLDPNRLFTMLEQFQETLSSSPSRSPGSFIYSVLPIAGDGLAVLTSADELLFLDKAGLEVKVRFHDDVPSPVSCMADCENAKNNVICAGADGEVAMFDVRSEKRIFRFKIGWSR
jgi:hypothetical protein